MNWLKILLSLAPYIVAGVSKIAGDNASGATKKQMATDALNIATEGALSVDPNDAAITQAAATVTGLVIDSTINDNKPAVTSQVIEHTVSSLKASGVLPTKKALN
jgi:hypothetical protein